MSSVSELIEEQKDVLLEGVHREKLVIERDDVQLSGGGTIVYNDHHGTFRSGLLFSTMHSASVTVRGKNFKASGITFRNDFDYTSATEFNRLHPESRISTQAVALRLDRESDNALFENCSFISLHDTLYADGRRAVFRNCHIEGNIDFIFGAGECLFENCDIVIRSGSAEAYVAAPSTFKGRNGFLFRGCRFSSPEKKGYYLARPWHPSGSEDRCPQAVFDSCTFDSFCNPEPFTSMGSVTPGGKRRVWSAEESRFSIR